MAVTISPRLMISLNPPSPVGVRLCHLSLLSLLASVCPLQWRFALTIIIQWHIGTSSCHVSQVARTPHFLGVDPLAVCSIALSILSSWQVWLDFQAASHPSPPFLMAFPRHGKKWWLQNVTLFAITECLLVMRAVKTKLLTLGFLTLHVHLSGFTLFLRLHDPVTGSLPFYHANLCHGAFAYPIFCLKYSFLAYFHRQILFIH